MKSQSLKVVKWRVDVEGKEKSDTFHVKHEKMKNKRRRNIEEEKIKEE